MRRALALLVLGIVALSMLVSTTLPRAVSFQGGYWRCITGSAVKTGYVSISKSSNAHVLTSTWNYPAFYEPSLGVWGYYKAYYILWTWDDRSAWIKASYSGRVHYATNYPPSKAYIYMYADKYAVRGKAKVWFKLQMNPAFARKVYSYAQQYGLTGLIRALIEMWMAESFVEAAINPVESCIKYLVMLFGVAYVVNKMVNPVTFTCTSERCKFELKPIYAWALSSNQVYNVYWGFKFEDDAGCDCFLWWCWNCEHKYPSTNLGLGIVADPEPEIQNVTVVMTRLIFVNESGAYLGIDVSYLNGTNVAVPIPSDAEVRKDVYDFGNRTWISIFMFWKKPFRSLNDVPEYYIVVNGSRVYPPPPNMKLTRMYIKSPRGYELYSSTSQVVKNGVWTLTILMKEETPSQMPIELYIAVAALVIASATFALVVVPKIAKTVVSETVRRKFVKPRSGA